MPNQSMEEPYQKVTLNLFKADIEDLKQWVGQGWQTYIRKIVHDTCRNMRTLAEVKDAEHHR